MKPLMYLFPLDIVYLSYICLIFVFLKPDISYMYCYHYVMKWWHEGPVWQVNVNVSDGNGIYNLQERNM